MEQISGRNPLVDTVCDLHLLKVFRRFSGRGLVICDLHAVWQALSPEGRAALEPHMRALEDDLAAQGSRRSPVTALALGCLYPGQLRGVDPVSCLSPSRGGFSARRRKEAASIVHHWDALEAFRQWVLPELNQGVTERLARVLPGVPPASGDTLEFACASATLHVGAAEEQYLPLIASYRDLTPADGPLLARRALEWLDSGVHDVAGEGGEMLTTLACLVPGSLNEIHGVLLDRGHLYPGILFHGAGGDARDRLIARIEESDESLSLALTALAWIGDERVQVAFKDWRSAPGAWSRRLHVPPEDYTLEAGWCVDAQGRRRDLYFDECYRLQPTHAVNGSGENQVQVLMRHDGACQWCGRALVNLFDINVSEPRMVFLGWPGGRLRIPICEHCSLYATVFAESTVDGEGLWSDVNVRDPGIPEADGDFALPQRRLALGEACMSPFMGLVADGAGSQIGGYPAWIEDAFYPACPRCKLLMLFVGQVHLADLGEPAEGTLYAHFCPACRVTTTHFQQT